MKKILILITCLSLLCLISCSSPTSPSGDNSTNETTNTTPSDPTKPSDSKDPTKPSDNKDPTKPSEPEKPVIIVEEVAAMNFADLQKYAFDDGKKYKVHLNADCMENAGLADFIKTKTVITEIIIDSGVTTISDNTFNGCSNIVNIIIPNTVKTIGTAAFPENCKIELLARNFAELKELFEGTNNKSAESKYKVHINSENIKSGGQLPSQHSGEAGQLSVFLDKNKIEEIIIDSDVINLGYGTFYNCTTLKTVTIASTTIQFDPSDFYNCANMQNINISPENTKYTSVDGVVYSKDKTILYKVPAGRLGTFEILDGVTSINSSAFEDSKLTTIILPNSLITISDYAFFNCTNLSSINLSENVKTIGNNAFSDCSKLSSIILPNSVKTIGENAFRNCKDLKEITMTKGVESIGNSCFSNSGIKRINFNSTEEDWNKISGINNAGIDQFCVIDFIYPNESPKNTVDIPAMNYEELKSYQFTDNGNFYKLHVNAENIKSGGFHLLTVSGGASPLIEIVNNNTNIKELVIDNDLKDIPYMEFNSCRNIRTITISEGIESIDQSAFAYCPKLELVRIPSSITSINERVFDKSENLSKIIYQGSKEQWDNLVNGKNLGIIPSCKIEFTN